MVRIPLIGIPKHLWKMLTGLLSASAGLILWRVVLIIGFIIGTAALFAATGGSGLIAVILGFAITTLLSKLLADDILAIWRNLWNAEWAEVKV